MFSATSFSHHHLARGGPGRPLNSLAPHAQVLWLRVRPHIAITRRAPLRMAVAAPRRVQRRRRPIHARCHHPPRSAAPCCTGASSQSGCPRTSPTSTCALQPPRAALRSWPVARRLGRRIRAALPPAAAPPAGLVRALLPPRARDAAHRAHLHRLLLQGASGSKARGGRQRDGGGAAGRRAACVRGLARPRIAAHAVPPIRPLRHQAWDSLAGSVPAAGTPCVCSRCEAGRGKRSRAAWDALTKPDYSPLLSPRFWFSGVAPGAGSRNLKSA